MYLYVVGPFIVALVVLFYPNCRGKTYARYTMIQATVRAWKLNGIALRFCGAHDCVEHLVLLVIRTVHTIMCPKTTSL